MDEITDGRGFEPLFFQIQGEFYEQRPFSEGCWSEISEKSKKNLSQSYGRWIVGFHEPMTSAFFALKKGATDWRYDMTWPCGKPAPFFRRADCCD